MNLQKWLVVELFRMNFFLFTKQMKRFMGFIELIGLIFSVDHVFILHNDS